MRTDDDDRESFEPTTGGPALILPRLLFVEDYVFRSVCSSYWITMPFSFPAITCKTNLDKKIEYDCPSGSKGIGSRVPTNKTQGVSRLK